MVSRILFPLAVAFYLACFRLPSGELVNRLDGSAHWVFNVYADHGLEFGRDIVHVAGPLGGLIYPVAGTPGFARACLFIVCVHGAFLACSALFARRTGRYGPAALFLAICAWFFFFHSSSFWEVEIYGIALAMLLMDLELGAAWLFAPAATILAVLAFAKFNVAVAAVVEYALFLALSRLRGDPWRRLLLKGASFVVPLAVLAASCFSSPQSLGRWIGTGVQVATSHSEAMSLLAPRIEVALAILAGLAIACIAIVAARSVGLQKALIWSALVAPLLFSEFKHGFVRADEHIYRFFEFAPVAAATYLIVAFRRRAAILIGLVVLIGIVTPAIRFSPNLPSSPSALGFEGIRAFAELSARERAAAERNRERHATLTPDEVAAISGGTVDVAPLEVILIEGTALRWRPSPVFQHFMARSSALDRLNAEHLRGPGAANFMIWKWDTVDGRHPLQEAPATFLAILNRYRFVSQTDDRLLLRLGPGSAFVPSFLGSARARWGEPIPVPPSEGMVLASIRIALTPAGYLLKAAYRIPPVYIRLDDGAAYRLVIGTAAEGVLVSRLPRRLGQFRFLLEQGRIDPTCPRTSSFSLKRTRRFNGLHDEIGIDFYELRIEPRH